MAQCDQSQITTTHCGETGDMSTYKSSLNHSSSKWHSGGWSHRLCLTVWKHSMNIGNLVNSLIINSSYQSNLKNFEACPTFSPPWPHTRTALGWMSSIDTSKVKWSENPQVCETKQSIQQIHKNYLTTSWKMFCELHFSKVTLADGFDQPIFSYVWLIRTAACRRSNACIVIRHLQHRAHSPYITVCTMLIV